MDFDKLKYIQKIKDSQIQSAGNTYVRIHRTQCNIGIKVYACGKAYDIKKKEHNNSTNNAI